MNPEEVLFTSDSKEYRVLYCRDDLGLKYRVQKKEERGNWKSIHWTDSPLDALTVMKRAAKEL